MLGAAVTNEIRNGRVGLAVTELRISNDFVDG